MDTNRFVTYLRVSTKKQEASGLGLEAQRKMCMDYITSRGGEFVREFRDALSGKDTSRPGLWAAIDFCKANSCTLVIAKLDRLARNVEFTFRVINSGIQIYVCDLPILNTLVLGVFATVAQYERELISGRTKVALDAIKDNISKNGGHMSKSGNWIKSLGNGGDYDTMSAVMAAHQARRKKAQDWRSSSALFKWVERQVQKGKTQKEILEEALELYEANPTQFCTRNGKPLCAGTLSRWVKELRIGI